MPGPFDTNNPNWITKEIGDQQTAVEMNQIVAAFKQNASVLQSLINKVSPQTTLQTTAQTHAGAINEILGAINSGFQIPVPAGVSPGQVYNFPALNKGQSKIIKIYTEDEEQNTIYHPDGSFWLGGYSGISA